MSDSIPDSQTPEPANKERAAWAEMPVSWIRASVLDDLVQAELDSYEQITASLPADDGPFAFLILLLTDKEYSIQTPPKKRGLVTFNPCGNRSG